MGIPRTANFAKSFGREATRDSPGPFSRENKMNKFKIICSLILLLASSLSQANDLSSVKACVTEGFNKLSNRNGIVVAIVDANNIKSFTIGAAKINQLYEIGSITKTFTANLLAQSVTDGSISLSDAIPAEYQKSGTPITFQNLTTHTSGIIGGMFPTFQSTNPLTPFDGLTTPVFKEHYAKTPLAAEPGSTWAYSNIGVSLMGLILAERAGQKYEDLVRLKVLNILGMNETYFEVPDGELNRLAEGHLIDLDGTMETMPHWDLFKTAIDPAGGLRSTISDMAKYAQANLVPESTALAEPIRRSQVPLYFVKNSDFWLAMNWIVEPDRGLIWHNGETYGFNAILAISKARNQAIVAMTDTTVLVKGADGKATFDDSLQSVAFDCLKK
jgi:CubicO group peptidase (beta-lactamase class C family)